MRDMDIIIPFVIVSGTGYVSSTANEYDMLVMGNTDAPTNIIATDSKRTLPVGSARICMVQVTKLIALITITNFLKFWYLSSIVPKKKELKIPPNR